MPVVTFGYEVADIVDAWSFRYNTLPVVRLARLAPWLMIVGGAALVMPAALAGEWGGATVPLVWLALGLLLLAWRTIVDRVVTPARARRFLAQQKSFQGEATLSWDASHIVFQNAQGQSRLAWGDFVRWTEGPGVLLLFQSDQIYNIVPVRGLSAAQAAEIRSHLTEVVGRGGGSRR